MTVEPETLVARRVALLHSVLDTLGPSNFARGKNRTAFLGVDARVGAMLREAAKLRRASLEEESGQTFESAAAAMQSRAAAKLPTGWEVSEADEVNGSVRLRASYRGRGCVVHVFATDSLVELAAKAQAIDAAALQTDCAAAEAQVRAARLRDRRAADRKAAA